MNENIKILNRLLENFTIIFWDFDGVIKDSLDVKSNAFAKLFSPFGDKLTNKIVDHHNNNGGVSRFKKIPLYLDWVGEKNNDENIKKYLKEFSSLVKFEVINSEWVSEVKYYIKKNYNNKYFVLLTATPQKEIEFILKKLNISSQFREVFGSPNDKSDIISKILKSHNFLNKNAVMVGDSKDDFIAAKNNDINFILKINKFNKKFQMEFNGYKFGAA